MINVPVLGQSLKIRKKAKWGKNGIFERKKKSHNGVFDVINSLVRARCETRPDEAECKCEAERAVENPLAA